MLTGPMNRTVPLVLAALMLGGCGSSSKPKPTASETAATSAPSPAMTHAEFVQALNASCAKGNAEADPLEKRFESAMERNELRAAGRTYNQILTLLRAHFTRISALDPPTEDGDAMRRYLSAQRRIIGYSDRMADSLLDNDLAGVQLLVTSFQREKTRRTTAAIDIGADKCGT